MFFPARIKTKKGVEAAAKRSLPAAAPIRRNSLSNYAPVQHGSTGPLALFLRTGGVLLGPGSLLRLILVSNGTVVEWLFRKYNQFKQHSCASAPTLYPVCASNRRHHHSKVGGSSDGGV